MKVRNNHLGVWKAVEVYCLQALYYSRLNVWYEGYLNQWCLIKVISLTFTTLRQGCGVCVRCLMERNVIIWCRGEKEVELKELNDGVNAWLMLHHFVLEHKEKEQNLEQNYSKLLQWF